MAIKDFLVRSSRRILSTEWSRSHSHEEVNVKFKLDSGADVTVISDKDFERFTRVKLLDLELAIDPLQPRGSFVHYNFLKLHYIRNKMTHVSPLYVGALTCNVNVN